MGLLDLVIVTDFVLLTLTVPVRVKGRVVAIAVRDLVIL